MNTCFLDNKNFYCKKKIFYCKIFEDDGEGICDGFKPGVEDSSTGFSCTEALVYQNSAIKSEEEIFPERK